MAGLDLRFLAKMVPNPRYDPRIRRGLWSVKRFELGTPFVLHTMGNGANDFYGLVPVSIDIPLFRISNLSEPGMVKLLLDNARSVDPKLDRKREMMLACATCQGNQWLNLVTRNDMKPFRAVCARCGNQLTLVKLLHEAGHA